MSKKKRKNPGSATITSRSQSLTPRGSRKRQQPTRAKQTNALKVWKKGKRKAQGVPQPQTAAPPRPQEEQETDKSKQAQNEQTYEKHQD